MSYTPDNEIEPRYRREMNTLAHVLDEHFNGDDKGTDRKIGFMLAVFPFGEGEQRRFNYISNASREHMLILLREMAARFEGQPEVKGTT